MCETDAANSTASVTEYFTGLAADYAEHRPTYPAAAIEWILDGMIAPIDAADIGCGTGISARLLAERGVNVIGVDPNADMLDEARRRTPTNLSVDYRVGAGERTGLPDASVDLVLCAQSFHWLDARQALREFHRIIKPGGRLALMWNMKVERNPFSAEFCRLAIAAQRDAETRGWRVPSERGADPTLGGFFAQPRRREYDNPQLLNLDGVLGRARSASYFPRSGPTRENFENELRESFARHKIDGHVVLTHDAEVTIADRA